MATLRRNEKLEALTGLRFVAAAIIVVGHAALVGLFPAIDFIYTHGVTIFFVLSGFILCHAYSKLEGWKEFKKFWTLRIGRIWPVHIFTLLLFIPVVYDEGNILEFIANAFMVHAWIPDEPYYYSFNAPSWSISTEFFFYLTFPFLVMNWRKTALLKWVVAGLLVVILYELQEKYDFDDEILYISPAARLFEFISGMLAYSVFVRLRPLASRLGAVNSSLIEFGIIALAVFALIERDPTGALFNGWRGSINHLSNVLVAASIFAMLIIALALEKGVASKLLKTRTAILLGEISYSVYLLHMIVFEIFHANNLPIEKTYALVVLFPIILLMALLTWFMIEIPCRNWVRSLVNETKIADAPVVEQLHPSPTSQPGP